MEWLSADHSLVAIRGVSPDVSSVGVPYVLLVRRSAAVRQRATGSPEPRSVRLCRRARAGLEDGVLRARPGHLPGGAGRGHALRYATRTDRTTKHRGVRSAHPAHGHRRLQPALWVAREHLGTARVHRPAVRRGQRMAALPTLRRLIRLRSAGQALCSRERMRTTTAPRVSAAPSAEALDWLRATVSVAFVLLLPLLLISTSLRGLVTDRAFIVQGFRDNQVARTTGLDQQQLERIADLFVGYFEGPPGQIQTQVTVQGQSRPLFNEREVQHMEDVQALIQWFLRMQIVAAAVVAIRLGFAVLFDRAPRPLGRDLLWSTGLIVALVVLVGVLSLIDFTELWTRFHQVAFRNDL